jgi:leucyl-tRNA synthetase
MDTFMCSNWYFLRYTSPHYSTGPFDADKIKYWLPVDLYTGGAEHAVMHLFYARFFLKAIRDMGLVDFDEPFTKLFNQGTIIAEHHKMSKSRGNVVTPDEYVNDLGADAVRTYLMFVGPWEQGGEWNDSSIGGVSRWLTRIWNLVLEDYQPKPEAAAGAEKARVELQRFTHQTIRKVTNDIDRLQYNTMIAALMEFTNYLNQVKEAGTVTIPAWNTAIEALILLLAPTTPHLSEELWALTGHTYSVHNQDWPKWNEALAKEEEITLVVQVNGKLRDRITVPASISETEARQLVLASPKVKVHLEGKQVINMVYVPGRLVNLVVK